MTKLDDLREAVKRWREGGDEHPSCPWDCGDAFTIANTLTDSTPISRAVLEAWGFKVKRGMTFQFKSSDGECIECDVHSQTRETYAWIFRRWEDRSGDYFELPPRTAGELAMLLLRMEGR